MKPNVISKYIALPSRIAMTLLLFLVIVSFLQMFAVEIAYEIRQILKPPKVVSPVVTTQPEKSEEEKRLERIQHSGKEFLPDGIVHLLSTSRYVVPGGFSRDRTGLGIYDVNGNLLWEGPPNEKPYEYLAWAWEPVDYYDPSTDARIVKMQLIDPEFSCTLEIPVNSQQITEEIWRYEPAREVFIGYRFRGNRIGYAGSTGFVNLRSEARPFGSVRFVIAWVPKDSVSPTLLWQTDKRIYEINFEKQQVQLLFESDGSKIESLRLFDWGFRYGSDFSMSGVKTSLAEKYRPAIHCLTDDGKHHLVMREPEQKVTITVPGDWGDDRVRLTATKDNIFLYHRGTEFKPPLSVSQSRKLYAQWASDFQSRPHKEWVGLYKVKDDGILELTNRFDWTIPARPSVTEIRQREVLERYVRYGVSVSPPLYDLVWYLFLEGKSPGIYRYIGGPNWILLMIGELHAQQDILNWIVCAVMVCFAFLHHWSRRTTFARFVFWLVFVGAFNLAGLLTYLAMNHTTVIKCPACGRRRGLAREDCVRCGAMLPAPQPRPGTLVFET
jgi:hypothetical protein